jgi:cytochrome c-type biogenesis protein
MLPAYLGYFVGLADDDVEPGTPQAVRRGLVIGAVVSTGFLVVFGVDGLLLTLGLRSIIELLPWAAMVIGVGVAILGVAMLAGYEPVVNLPKPGRAGTG